MVINVLGSYFYFAVVGVTRLIIYIYIISLLKHHTTTRTNKAFLTKAACCRNIEIVLHPMTLSYIYILIVFTQGRVYA